MLHKVTHCAGRVLANTRPHQLHRGDQEMGTAISCTECSQVAGLIQKSVETPQKHRLFVQLFFYSLVPKPGYKATVLRAAVFHLKILCNNRNHWSSRVHVIGTQMHACTCAYKGAGGAGSTNG